MDSYLMLQQAINYMEEHLLEKINYEWVAKSVHMSGYEFHRTFRYLSGMTANVYIRSRRLSLAGQELMEKGGKITDIAFKYGYDTPESFTKAFTRFHGVAPKYARNSGVVLKLFQPLVIKITMEGGKTMDYRMEKTKTQKFAACVKAFEITRVNEEGNHDIPDFWDECHSMNKLEYICRLRPEGKRDLYGLCSPSRKGETTFEYGIGVLFDEETEAFDEVKLLRDGYRIWEVEAGDYAVFTCMGKDGGSIEEMWSRFYKEFLPQTGYEAAERTDYEIYYEKGKPGMFCELWIPVKRHSTAEE